MKQKSVLKLVSLVYLMNISTTALAASETRILGEDTYQKTERQLVQSTGTKVEVGCEGTDELLDGACFGEDSTQFAREYEHGIFLNSEQVEQNHWSCAAKVIHPPQVLRVDSIVTCKKAKANSKNSNSNAHSAPRRLPVSAEKVPG